ncbi:MAG: 1-acyl-sn-glycerol-3-phosphate acyltransferase [Prolixibacteraceae bacterium]|nr:1-acyl-sn-glycerol-3-phosphate acyltransferase [Prolixibacteraceae bacterium]
MEEQKKDMEKPINIEKVFMGKNPRLAKLMPRFIFSFINRVLHVDFLNAIFTRNGHLKGIEFVNKAIQDFNVTEKVYGFENIPDSGKFIFASNHPLGGFDSLLLMKYVEKKLGNLRFLTNDVLMAIPNLNSMFIPINKHGSNSREAAKLLSETYDSDLQILIFPSGLASRKVKGKVVDLEWKKHFISKSVQHKRDVIPVFIGGRNSNRFYTTANIRKFLHIKWNLEMFLLPDESLKQKNKEIPIYFGKPIPYSTFDKLKTHDEWAAWVKNKVYSLPNEFDRK